VGVGIFQSVWGYLPLGVALLVIGVSYFNRANAWRTAFKSQVMTRLVKGIDPNLRYHPMGYITRMEYEQSLLFHNAPSSQSVIQVKTY